MMSTPQDQVTQQIQNSQYAKEPFGIFTGGVNYARPVTDIAPDEVAHAYNMLLHPGGYCIGRQGTTKLNTAALDSGSAVVHLAQFIKRATGVSHLLGFTASGKVYRLNDNGSTDLLASGLTVNRRWSTVEYQDILVCVNGADPPKMFDGTTFGALPGLHVDMVAPQFTTVHGSKCWLFGDRGSAFPHRLYGSDDINPQSWSTPNNAVQINVYPDYGGFPSGMKSFFDDLIIGKDTSIFRLAGTSAANYTLIPFSQKAGFSSHWMIEQMGNNLIFLDGTHLKSLAGVQEAFDIRASDVAFNLTPVFEGQAPFAGIHRTNPTIGNLINEQNSNQLFLNFPESGQAQNNRFFIANYNFNPSAPAWWPQIYPKNYATIAVKMTGPGTFKIYGGRYDGFVDEFAGQSDNGAIIERYVKTRGFSFGSFEKFKRFPWLYIEFDIQASAGFDIYYSVEESSNRLIKSITGGAGTGSLWDSAIWDTSLWAAEGTLGRVMIPIYGARGRFIQYAFKQALATPGNLAIFKGVGFGSPRTHRAFGTI